MMPQAEAVMPALRPARPISDTFRKDGLRVEISAVNAGAYLLAASRNEPALNIGQLKQMALSTAWQRASG
ncbi:hypothetical protein ACWDA7_44310 [Streptomyces sp. NPDC001156]